MSELMVRRVVIEDEATGEHEFGAARAVVMLAFGGEGAGFTAVGTFSTEDVVDAARTLGLIAGTGLSGLGDAGRRSFELLMMTSLLDGLRDVGRQARMCADSAANEMGATLDGR